MDKKSNILSHLPSQFSKKTNQNRGRKLGHCARNVFLMKKLVLFYTMAAFKHLSKQARCWLAQTNNTLYVLLAHSASHPISHLSQKPPQCIHQLLPGGDSSHS